VSLFKKSTSSTYLLVILFLITVVNYLDRQVLSIVQEDIKVDLNLTDSQLGYLVLAFGLMHALLAIPIGRMADKKSRKKILATCLAIWSGFTALGGSVNSFVQLFITRLGVGGGEAGVTPTSYSLVSDKFPLNKRATALAVLAVGISIGAMFSLILGGKLADTIGWRWTFVAFGIPGLILAIIFMLTIEAPARGESDKISKVKESDFGQTMGFLFKSRSFVLALMGAMFNGVAGYSVLGWYPSYYIRTFGLSKSEVGLAYGLTIGITGFISLMTVSYLADRLGKSDVRWYAWIITVALLIAAPFFYSSIFVDSFSLSLTLAGVGLFFGQSVLAINNSLIQNTSPVQMRGVGSAIKTTVMSFVGYGVGGAVVGVLADYFATDDPSHGLKMALAVIMSFYLLAALVFFMSSFTLKKDIERAVAMSAG